MFCPFMPSVVGFEVQRAQSHNGLTEPASAFPNFLDEKDNFFICQYKRVLHYSPVGTGQNPIVLKLNLKANKIVPYSVK